MTLCLLPSLEQVGEGEVRMLGMPILLIQRNYIRNQADSTSVKKD